MRLTAIHRYPVKSFRGEPLAECVVEPWGLAGDRRLMVVGPDGTFVTAREHPRMLLITPTLLPDGGLRLTSPDAPPLVLGPPHGIPEPVRVWRSHVLATPAGADAWLTAVLGRPAHLVHLDDPRRRTVDPDFGRPDDTVSFADGYPLLLTTEASLADLAGQAPEPVPMLRFRPNVVVDGELPWAEDGWRRVRIGDAVFLAVKGCARCVMTTVDPETAAKGKEPIRTLAKRRRFDGGTWFGMNLIPDTAGVTIRVGDEVEVLEAVPAPDGPPR